MANKLSKYNGFQALEDSFSGLTNEMINTGLRAIQIASKFPALHDKEVKLLEVLHSNIQQVPALATIGISITFSYEQTIWSVILDEDFFEISDSTRDDGEHSSRTHYKFYSSEQEAEIEGDLEVWLEELMFYSDKKDFSVSIFGGDII